MNPVILEGFIASIASGAVKGLDDARGLQNRTDQALEVKEIRFLNANVTLNGGKRILYQSIVDVQLRLGNEPITSGFIPVPAMTVPIDFTSEYGNNTYFLQDEFVGKVLRFSKPFILMPGETINVQVRVPETNAAQQVKITAICYPTKDISRAHLPWITAFLPPAHADASGKYDDVSTEADLVNPFEAPILVERMIGRVFFRLADPIDIEAGRGQGIPLLDKIRLRMEDHNGVQIAREPTPIGLIFEASSKSWVINNDLPSKGHFVVAIESDLSSGWIDAEGEGSIRTMIGMISYRKIG